SDHNADHGPSRSPSNDGPILQYHRNARVTRRPGRAGPDENAAVIVGNGRGVVGGVTDRICGIDRWPKPKPGSTHLSARLVRLRMTDNAVRVKGRENRNERRSRGCGDGDELGRGLDPLRSFFSGLEDSLQ